jgi:hypothetical protein
MVHTPLIGQSLTGGPLLPVGGHRSAVTELRAGFHRPPYVVPALVSHRSPITGEISGRRSPVSGHRARPSCALDVSFTVSFCRSPVTGHQLPVKFTLTGSRLTTGSSYTGHRSPGAFHRSPVTSQRSMNSHSTVTGFLDLIVDHRSLVVSTRRS